ncbi:flotillin-like protein FloA [Roseiconus nitratireducens]|uniref:Flotillin-like protein FloA n=2 Tax=Roseiconus nitratireducens TaxID=2605748 RepID=A0A5M6D9S0_9BACT|nr:flotillin-like protein FloA [Roseiconus nitratireducens]
MPLAWVPTTAQITVAVVLLGILAVLIAVFARWGSYWIQAYMSGADVSMASLIAMSFLKIEHRLIVTAKVMARQAGLDIDRKGGISTARLQAHQLAGGDVMNVMKAIIAAHRAGIDLNFDRAAAIDLAGRDVLLAVQTSVSPRVIRCPMEGHEGTGNRTAGTLSAVAKNGVELLVSARVTVRTNLEQLIGGATEETIIARVGQGIVTSIGSADSHMDVLEMPSLISKGAMAHGLDVNTAYEIVSIDIADIDVGENIGARLQKDQADADVRVARAAAEVRRAEAVARKQQMKARVALRRAELVIAESEVPKGLAAAFRAGQIRVKRIAPPRVRSRRLGDGGGDHRPSDPSSSPLGDRSMPARIKPRSQEDS